CQLWINGIVKDCTTNLGGLFRKKSFKHILQQNCLMHVKWIVSAHVKAFAGMSKRSNKPLPKEWRWLRSYGIIRGEQLKHGLPDGVYDGYNEKYKGIWLTNEEGIPLIGPVQLLDSGVLFMSDEDIATLIRNDFKSYQIKVDKKTTINGFRGQYYRSGTFEAGNGLRSVIQEVDSISIPTGTHEDILSGDLIRNPTKPARISVSIKEDFSLDVLTDVSALTTFMQNALYGMEKGLRGSASTSFTHRMITVSPRLLGLHNSEIDGGTIVRFLGAIEPRNGEKDSNGNNFPANWLDMITLFSFGEGTAITDNKLDSFKMQKNILELIKNVLRRGSSDPSYQYFKDFKDLLSDNVKFEGDARPIVDTSQNINDAELMERVNTAWNQALGYMVTAQIKLGLLTFQKDGGNFKIIHGAHNYLDWFRLTSRFNVVNLGRSQKAPPNIERYQERETYAIRHLSSVLLSGNLEMVQTVNNDGVLNEGYYHLRTEVPLDSPFLQSLFNKINSLTSKISNHITLRNQFLERFWVYSISPTLQSKSFFEGRMVIKQKIGKMVEDQISPERVAAEFKTEIDALSSTYSVSKSEAIKIKRKQVIRVITNLYTENILNPQGLGHEGKTSAGDFALHMRKLLQDPLTTSLPIHFPYSAQHPFWGSKPANPNAFELIFDLSYFSQEELSSVIPTLSYTYTGTFSNEPNTSGDGKIPRVEHHDLIQSLFSASVLFSQMSERLTNTFKTLKDYFTEYLQNSEQDEFTLRFFKEMYSGFDKQTNNIGASKTHGGINKKYWNAETLKELKGTSIKFSLKDANGEINGLELNRMISNLVYYTNQYDAIAEVLEGFGNKAPNLALIMSPHEFLTPDYFMGTYAEPKAIKTLTGTALMLYNLQYTQYRSYSTFYNDLSDSGLLPGFLLQNGNNNRMRPLYNGLFKALADASRFTGEDDLILDLGYKTVV
ncbi:hypothetical protein LCGC14_1192400, partial [marine sediment metagenome]